MEKPLYAMRISELRKIKNLTQEELAKNLGISRGRLSNYEQGIREPDFQTLSRFADFFAVSTDYLLGNTNEPRKGLISPELLTMLNKYEFKSSEVIVHLENKNLTEEERTVLSKYKMMEQYAQEEQLIKLIEKFKSLPEADQEALTKFIDSLASSRK